MIFLTATGSRTPRGPVAVCGSADVVKLVYTLS